MDFLSVFTTPDAWVTLAILIFLELVLGIDNLVFIAITTDRLPESKKKIGRRFGLGAALAMRVIFLCFASWMVSLTSPLFSLPFTIPNTSGDVSVKDLVLLVGGIYLIYKGILEIREMLSLKEERADHEHASAERRQIGLAQAVGTIAVMDIVFSIDSVITAVGLAGGMLLVMIIAVMLAVFVMIIFADVISEFINSHPEMKLLALVFITMVGIKLVIEGFEIELLIEHTSINALDVGLYTAMACSLVLTILQMSHRRRLAKLRAELEAPATQEPKDAE